EVRDEVHPVTDAEYRRDLERRRLRRRNVLAVHRVRTAAENDPRRRPLADEFDRPRWRMNLGVDARLANTASDELCVLRAVIDDENSRAHQRRHSEGSSTRNSTCLLSRARIAAAGVPYSHPQAPPGLTLSASPCESDMRPMRISSSTRGHRLPAAPAFGSSLVP